MFYTNVTASIKDDTYAETLCDQLATKGASTPGGNITEKSTSDDDADDEYQSAEESTTSTPRLKSRGEAVCSFSAKAEGSNAMDALVDDLRLVECLWDMAGIGPSNADASMHLRRVVAFLRACRYSAEEICVIFAHASVYFDAIKGKCKPADVSEILNIMILLMFIAHSYVQDHHCPLHCWHKHLFKKYCTLQTLNRAIMSIMKLRGYVLRVEDDLLYARCDRLLSAASLPNA